MNNRKFWLTSTCSFVAAICLHLGALGKAQNGIQSFSSAMNLNLPEEQRSVFKMEAHQFFKTGNVLRFMGYFAALLGAASLVYSYKKNEPAPRSATVGLSALYLLLQFAVV